MPSTVIDKRALWKRAEAWAFRERPGQTSSRAAASSWMSGYLAAVADREGTTDA